MTPNNSVIKLILFLSLCLLGFKANSNNTDSLKTELNNAKADSSIIKILSQIGWEYLYIDLDSSIHYEKQALELSIETNNHKGKGIALTHLGYIDILYGNYTFALEKYNEAQKIFKSTNDKYHLAITYTNIANAYFYLSDYSNNIKFNNQALEIGIELNDSLTIANTYTSLGNAYLKLGDYPKALEYFMGSVGIYESKSITNKLPGCYNNIAIVLKKQGDKANALKYYKLSLNLAKEYGSTKSIGEAYNNIGVLQMEKGEFNKANNSFLKALELFVSINYQTGIATVNSNIGENHINYGNYNEAISYFFNAKEQEINIGNMEGYSTTLFNLSNVYFLMDNIKQAKEFALEGIEISKQIQALEIQNRFYKILAEIEYKENQFIKAYDYLNLYILTKDSLFNIEKTKEIEIIKTLYEVDKKEIEISNLEQKTEILSQQNKIQQLQLLKNRIILFSVLGIIILLIITIIMIINRERIKTKKNKEIEQAKKALLEQEMKNIKLEKNSLNSELEYRKIEVANLATRIIEQDKLISGIKNKMHDISGQNNTEFSKIIDSVSMEIKLNKSREDFYLQVDSMHKDFFLNLSNRYPKLSKNDKKLAALLRMEMSSKDIATILNISAKSVDMNRYRLRKKLNIDTETNITDYLKNI